MAKWPHGHLEKNSVVIPSPTNMCVSGFLLEQRASAEGDPAQVRQPRRVQRLLQPQRARAAGVVGHREEHVQALHLPGEGAGVEGSLQVTHNIYSYTRYLVPFRMHSEKEFTEENPSGPK